MVELSLLVFFERNGPSAMCQYCGNTGLCYAFYATAIMKAWRWIKMFLATRFARRSNVQDDSKRSNEHHDHDPNDDADIPARGATGWAGPA
jgi:hypothetical protein